MHLRLVESLRPGILVCLSTSCLGARSCKTVKRNWQSQINGKTIRVEHVTHVITLSVGLLRTGSNLLENTSWHLFALKHLVNFVVVVAEIGRGDSLLAMKQPVSSRCCVGLVAN